MSQEKTNNDILPLYYSAVECYEEINELFCNKNVDFELIKVCLKKCCVKIDHILEKENNCCTLLVDLVQLKQHASELIVFLDKNSRNTSVNELKNKKVSNTEQPELKNLIESTIEIPRIRGLQQVAGLTEIKKILKSLIILPKNQPQLFYNQKLIKSILLYGPPGTGKTHLIHALSHDAGALLFSVSASNILSPLIGQSEKNLKYLFEYIKNQNTFCLLFVDEVDGFCRKRSGSEHEYSRRIKTELLCQLNKMESLSNLFLIAATNCPWDLDPAFLRRFQKRLYIPLPDYSDRRDLFKLFTQNTNLEETFGSWEHLIERTEGFSGSDISDLITQALNYPVLELEDTKVWMKNSSDGFYEPLIDYENFNTDELICSNLADLPPFSVKARKVQPNDLFKALNTIKVTVTEEDIKRYDMFSYGCN